MHWRIQYISMHSVEAYYYAECKVDCSKRSNTCHTIVFVTTSVIYGAHICWFSTCDHLESLRSAYLHCLKMSVFIWFQNNFDPKLRSISTWEMTKSKNLNLMLHLFSQILPRILKEHIVYTPNVTIFVSVAITSRFLNKGKILRFCNK